MTTPEEASARILQIIKRKGEEAVNSDKPPPVDADTAELMDAWRVGDVADAIANGLTTPHPEILTYTDGRGALFYRGKVNGLHGDSGIGKSWSFLIACKQEMEAGHDVLILDYESSLAEIIMRLQSLMVSDEVMIQHLHHISPHAEAAPEIIAWVCRYVIEHGITLVGIDSLGEAFGIEGINEDKDVEVGPWLRRVARPIAEAGPAVVTIDHGTKAADNPLHPSGSKRKRAAITGASYLVTTTNPPTQEKAGKLQLTCAKDRHGTYARGKLVATIELEPHPDGGLGAKVWPPMPSDEKRADIGIMLCARDAVRVAKKEGAPLSQRSLSGLITMKGGSDVKRAGIELAVSRGNLRLEPGPRGAHLHVYVSDFDMNHGDTP